MKKVKKVGRRAERKDLSVFELQSVFRMRVRGISYQEISLNVGCSKSTVCRVLNHESLKRQDEHLPWYEKAKIVHDAVRENRGRPKDKGWGLKNERIRGYVVEHLEDRHSPATISKKLSKDHPEESISPESIYQYCYTTDRTLIKKLPMEGKTKRNRAKVRSSRGAWEAKIEKRRIDERGEAANNRSEMGHVESDYVVSGGGGKSCLFVMVDRKVREVHLRKTENREAETTRKVAFEILNSLPEDQRAKSYTVDNDPAHNNLIISKLVDKNTRTTCLINSTCKLS